MKEAKVRSWGCRVFRWLDQREAEYLLLPWWMCGVMLAIAMVLSCALVWQLSLISDPKTGQALRILSVVSHPLGWAMVAVFAFTGVASCLYRGMGMSMRRKLGIYFGNAVAEATKGFGYCDDREIVGTVDRKLAELAAAVPDGDAITRRQFWRATNLVWSFGFRVKGLDEHLGAKKRGQK